MLKTHSLLHVAAILFIRSIALAELPLPDATFFGKITTPTGVPVGSGALTARVRRGATSVLQASGSFVAADGELWYVVRIPLETHIGAPGPSGVGAREGDELETLLLIGKPLELKSAAPVLKAGLAARLDAIATDVTPPGSLIFRGDCSPDLKLSITDAVRVLVYLFISPEAPPCLAACDSDGNGRLNIADGIYLLSFLFLGGPAPPEPGPKCGLDPSSGELGCAQATCSV